MTNGTEDIVESIADKWIRRIKLMLGGSRILSLEVTDEEIKELIDLSYEKALPYAVDIDYITVQYAACVDLTKFGVTEVYDVFPASQLSLSGSPVDELMFDWQAYRKVDAISTGKLDKLAIVRKSVLPDVNIPFMFDSETKKLYLTEGYTTGAVCVEVVRESSLEDLRDERVLQWIFSYALALTKEVVGRIRSKAKSSNVPIELDGDTLLNEAQTEKQTLESSLVTDQFGPTLMIR